MAVTGSDVKPVELNSSYTITLTPDADSYIKTFKVDGNVVDGNTYSANISADVAVTVEFAKKQLYTVNVNSTQDGTVTVDNRLLMKVRKLQLHQKLLPKAIHLAPSQLNAVQKMLLSQETVTVHTHSQCLQVMLPLMQPLEQRKSAK